MDQSRKKGKGKPNRRKHKDRGSSKQPHHQTSDLSSSNSHTSLHAGRPHNSTKQSVPLPLSFPAHLPRPTNHHEFLLNQPPYKASFQAALDTSYQGFVVDEDLPQHHHPQELSEKSIQSCLDQMQAAKYFRRDVTQPFGLGTKCAKTYVTRCLVGDPGTTYKYLGLRMFAHPWKKEEPTQTLSSNREASTQTLETTHTIRTLSESLSTRTRDHLEQLDQRRRQQGAPNNYTTRGRSTFDICLINRMDPSEQLKPLVESSGQSASQWGTSVSWHADSSLEHYSTIAVYQTLVDDDDDRRSPKHGTLKKKTISHTHQDQWYVAMRVTPHVEGPTAGQQKQKASIESTVDTTVPPIAVALPSGSTYYLLDDFNHHHQHAVLKQEKTTKSSGTAAAPQKQPPNSIRYSCTFRLLRDSHSVQYILQRCQSTIPSQFHKKGLKVWRSEQLLLNEVEMEWLRQFFIQGRQHFDLLWEPYWKEPMTQLLQYWGQLEERTRQVCEWLELAARGKCSATTPGKTQKDVPTKAERKTRDKERKALASIQGLVERTGNTEKDSLQLYETMAEFLEERAKSRELWMKREKDHVFTDLAPELRPMIVPFEFVDDETNVTTKKTAFAIARSTSPLPGRSEALRDLASALRTFGGAFVTGRAVDLPTNATFKAAVSSTISKSEDMNPHSRPLTWSGWDLSSTVFGLELQAPWAGAILDGRKEIETRSYDLPPALLGKYIYILESPSGEAGVSAMGNTIDLQKSPCRVIGWCRFTSVIRYNSRGAFEADENRHLVDSKSGYAWKDGKTREIFGWIVGEHARLSPKDTRSSSFAIATRRMRSLFELKPLPTAGKRKSLGSSGHTKKKKKKRY